MKQIILNQHKYLIVKDFKDAIIEEEILKRYTDYFEDFDFIVGDWAYGKLRLKGFNNKENANFNAINDVAGIDSYLQNYCAYDCRYFILQKEKD